MRKALLFVGLALLACLLLPVGALAGAGGNNLPLKVTGAGYSTVNQATGQIHSEATAIGSHAGLQTLVQEAQMIPTADPTQFGFQSTVTGTAANGDQTVWACSGVLELSADTSTTELDCVMTGGTGRFEGATGTMHSVVDGINATGYFEFTNVGTFSWNHK